MDAFTLRMSLQMTLADIKEAEQTIKEYEQNGGLNEHSMQLLLDGKRALEELKLEKEDTLRKYEAEGEPDTKFPPHSPEQMPPAIEVEMPVSASLISEEHVFHLRSSLLVCTRWLVYMDGSLQLIDSLGDALESLNKQMQGVQRSELFNLEGWKWTDLSHPHRLTFSLRVNGLTVTESSDMIFHRDGEIPQSVCLALNMKQDLMDLKEDLEDLLLQAETEYFIWSSVSSSRVMQVLTDLRMAVCICYSGCRFVNYVVVPWNTLAQVVVSGSPSIEEFPPWKKLELPEEFHRVVSESSGEATEGKLASQAAQQSSQLQRALAEIVEEKKVVQQELDAQMQKNEEAEAWAKVRIASAEARADALVAEAKERMNEEAEAWAKVRIASAEARADSAEARADALVAEVKERMNEEAQAWAKARIAEAEAWAKVAEVQAQIADVEARAKAQIAEAEARAKAQIAEAEARAKAQIAEAKAQTKGWGLLRKGSSSSKK